MRHLLAALTLLTFASAPLTALPDSKPGPVAIRVTPPAPKYSDAERQAELARRRAAVAAKMADNSMLVLFSAEPKLYTNDVNYVFRQENNLYYLTGLRQANATFVMLKQGGKTNEFIFIPKRD